jgi:EAL domain-containing protein (putative c-di-GMP-specific phosphodiesterase class I)
VNLPSAGRLIAPLGLPSLRRGPRGFVWSLAAGRTRRPGMTILSLGLLVTLISATLEIVNPGNYWVLFEDVSCGVAPAAAAIAMAIAAVRGEPEYRAFRISLAIFLGLTVAGQFVADITDLFGGPLGPLSVVSGICYVVGAALAVATLMVTLYRRLECEVRRAVVLDGLIIVVASVTLVFANWLHGGYLPGGQVGVLFADPAASLFVPLVSSLFFSSAAVVLVAALWLRIQPERRGVWAVALGIVLLAVAWSSWIDGLPSGAPDGIALVDFVFPAGALIAGYGGLTWSLSADGGARYERFARAVSDWLPMAAIVGCAVLDVMPHLRPLEVDPIAFGTCAVVFLVVARQRILQGRARTAAERLTSEISERAATTFSLARFEAGDTIEATADRVCSEALRIDGIDTVTLFAFSPAGVVPIALSGPSCRPVVLGQPLPENSGLDLQKHAEFGLWLESWTGRVPRDDFDRATIASGLQAEALAPLMWNSETIGILSMGAVSPANARRLSERLATLTEFSVMSAAVLGPKLSERWHRDVLRAEIQNVIDTQAFKPVFQPVVDLATGRLVGFEALTRFADGTRPDLRFMAADKVGMMVELEKACLNVQVEKARSLPEGSFVSLNISPALATMLDPLIDILTRTDRVVVLEITEHVVIEDYPRLMAALDQVRPYAMLAVDDAGAGYAGLRHILELRPQYVKLDISLVRNIDNDPARQAMVTGMAHFAETVGCALIAEGIETENELTAVRLLNIGYGQGYFLARPAPVETFSPAAAASPVATPAAATPAHAPGRPVRQPAAKGARRPRRRREAA